MNTHVYTVADVKASPLRHFMFDLCFCLSVCACVCVCVFVFVRVCVSDIAMSMCVKMWGSAVDILPVIPILRLWNLEP